MHSESPDKLRQKFNTPAGLEAFDRLNALGSPRWTFGEDGGKVYLSPSLEVKTGSILSSPGNGWGQNVDDIVISTEKALKAEASAPGTRVVANAMRESRREFTYDKASNAFTPYLKP